MRAAARLAALAVLAVAALAGCVRLTSTTEVHADDTFSQEAIIATTEQARQQLSGLANLDFGDLKGAITSSKEYLSLSAAYPDQIAVDDYTEGDLTGVKITATNLPLDAFETTFAQFTARLPFTAKGIVITNVASDSPADRMGLMAGDIILNLNGTDIRDVSTFKRIASGDVQGWQITLQRQGQLIRTYIDG